MTKDILARANSLNEKIIHLKYYLECYAIPSARCHKIKIIIEGFKRILRASNFRGACEYELDYEEFKIVNDALLKKLEEYEKEFRELRESD